MKPGEGSPVTATPAKIPPPVTLDVPKDGLAQPFSSARQKLDDILGEQNRRVTELQLAATQGLEQAMSRLEDSCRFTRGLLERNESLAREAERLTSESEQLGGLQKDLEEQVQKTSDHNQQSADRATQLRTERERVEAEAVELDEAVRLETDLLGTARANLERLQERREKLQEENAQLERARNRLEETIARLERVREEYMTVVKRAKTTVNELVTKDTDEKSDKTS